MTTPQTTEQRAADLRPDLDPATLEFTTTETLEPLDQLVGQERAIEAIGLAAGIRSSRFNLFAYGPEGTRRHNTRREWA